MMGVRALCLVVATVLVSLRVPMLWLWVPICLVGMVLLPWLAVLLANDGPPKPEHRMIRRPRAPVRPTTAGIAAAAGDRPKVIDLEP
jgi:threonine/homoserine/homoserine lactone efflux protein